MKKNRIAAALLCVLTAASLCACGGNGSIDDYLQNHDVHLEASNSDTPAAPEKPGNTEKPSSTDAPSSNVSASDVSFSDVSGTDASEPTTTTTETTTTATTTTAAAVVTALPEELIGSWSVISVYQEAIASDITVDEALRREQAGGISFGSAYFDRSGESIQNARFVVNTAATYNDMERMGISTKPLMGPYGSDAKITSVEISTDDGMLCTTVFLINDTTLVAFGSGMNVFTYEQMEAVG